MEIKHTRGPWTYRYDGINEWGAEVWTMDSTNIGHSEIAETYTVENAMLIAAAPELLKALIAVVKVADRATVEFDLARAAIAKATGQ